MFFELGKGSNILGKDIYFCRIQKLVKTQNTLEYLERFSHRPVRFFMRQTMKNQKNTKILKIWETVVKLLAPSSETVLGKG